MNIHIRTTLGLCTAALICALTAAPSAEAQVAGKNVNMVSGTIWPKGDPFLQRQNEPSMAVSTRNPMHILAGANDYRTVDLELLLSDGKETGDSWLGLFKSFDGGLRWESNLLPGCPYFVPQCTDNNGNNQPALGGIYQAASDPVVRAGTNGMFYYAGLAFTRNSQGTLGSTSAIFVARYNDLNNNEKIDPIAYIDTQIIATGNGSHLFDKPALVADIPRPGANPCSFTASEPDANGGTRSVHQSFAAGNVYVAFTDFLGPTKGNNIPTHLMFTRSTNCGVTWSTPIQVNTGSTTSQGSTIAVNPWNGSVYVAWRQFGSTGVPDAIMVAQSNNGGKSFGAPVRISTFQPFDQGTTGTSFRTNAYPSITTDLFGFVYVAFSARGLGPNGDARVVAAGSIDGTHWTPAIMVDNPPQNAQTNPSGRGHQIMPAITFANGRLTLLYYDLRFDHYQNFYTPNPNSPGTYTSTLIPKGELAPPNPNPSKVFTPYVDDAPGTLRRHTIDLRVLELGIFPTVVLGPSVSVTQYDYGCCVNPLMPDIEQFKFNVPNLPLFAQGHVPFLGDYIEVVPSPLFVPQGSSWVYNFKPSVNPLFHATWTDNRDVIPPPDGHWDIYTPPVPTGTPSIYQPGQTTVSCVPGQGREGMRNQNIYTAQISGGLVVGAPGNAKPLGTTTFNGNLVPFQRAFAVEAQNITNQPINVRFTIANQPTGGSASFLQFFPLTTLDITIPARSSVSRSVFVKSTDAHATITVNVVQISAIGGSVVTNGLSSSAVLNPDITNPDITNPDITNPDITNLEVTNPDITNPDITNPDITNPDITNPDITNPDITNPDITNPDITNPGIPNGVIMNPDITNPDITNPDITNPDITNGSIQDVIYRMSNKGNTTSTYTVKVATFVTVPGGVVLQLILNKKYLTPTANNCQLGTKTHWVTVANITNPKLFSSADPQLGNPDITNSTPNEASVTLGPGETGYIMLRVVNPTPTLTPFNPLTAVAPVTIPQAVNTLTVLSNPGNTSLTAPAVYPPLTILTASLPSTELNGPSYSVQLQSSGGKPGSHTWSIASGSGSLPNGLNLSPAGLISGTPGSCDCSFPATFTFTVQVVDTATPQNVATRQLTITVARPVSIATTSLPNPSLGSQYNQPITATGGLPPFTWSSTGTLPPGVTLGNDGTLSGMPTTAGTYQFTVKVTDSLGLFSSASFTVVVASPLQPQAIRFIAQPNNAVASQAISTTVRAVAFGPNEGPDIPIPNVQVAIGFGIQTCPAATLSGTLTGTTNSDGTFTFSNLSIDRGGQGYTLSASVVSNPNVFGTSGQINVEGFCDTGNLAVGRRFHAAFPLVNGKILIAGGTANADGTGALASAELYDPATHAFTQINSMNNARADFSITQLANGKVLIAGGFNDAGSLASAELFDPATNTFTLLLSTMTSPRAEHTATLLPTGQVLITGGNSNSTTSLLSAELFNPTTISFTASGGAMSTVRQVHHADMLPNGKVLITGGLDSFNTPLASAELYDPATDRFAATGSMGTARGNHASALLYTGKVLVAGGTAPSGATATAELYDPSAGTFSSTGNMTGPRNRYFATVLQNGLVFIADGSAGKTADIYDPAAGTSGTFRSTGMMTTTQSAEREALLTDGTVLVTGGSNGSSTASITNAEIFYPITNSIPAPTTFTSSASFLAALSTRLTITETYEGLPSGTVIPAGTTVDNLTYSGFPTGVAGLVNGAFASIGTQSLTAQRGTSPSFFFTFDLFTITFPLPVKAAGIFFNAGLRAAPGSYCIVTTSGTACNSSTYDISSLYFVGLISNTPFTSVTITGNGGPTGYNVDNLTYAP